MTEPTSGHYPQFDRLWTQARSARPVFVSPADLTTWTNLVRGRGNDWCTRVLGREFNGVRGATGQELTMLVLADQESLDPPLPPDIAAARAAARAEADRRARDRATADQADVDAWDRARTGTTVPVLVRPNLTGRRYSSLTTAPLRHAVPARDALSGPEANPRRHPAGRPVCETVTRAKPRRLGEPVQDPVTCRSCLKLVPTLRPPAP